MAQTDSVRQRILDVVETRLCAIRRHGGFRTNAGACVVVNALPKLGPDDPFEAIAVLVSDDQSRVVGNKVLITLPIEIAACVREDAEGLWKRQEQVLADVKEAIELPDRLFGGLLTSFLERGLTRTHERVEGSTVAAVGITYSLPYAETWGTP